jgi:hypothetical protein
MIPVLTSSDVTVATPTARRLPVTKGGLHALSPLRHHNIGDTEKGGARRDHHPI